MNKSNPIDIIKGLLVLIGLVIFAIAAIAAAFKLAAWLWERSVALCLETGPESPDLEVELRQ